LCGSANAGSRLEATGKEYVHVILTVKLHVRRKLPDHTDHHRRLLVTQRDGFLAAILGVRDSDAKGLQFGFEDVQIDRQIREIRITRQSLQQSLTLRQYLLWQRLV